jgi:hypothetical protein
VHALDVGADGEDGRFGFQRGVIVASRAHLGFPA